MPAPVPPGYTRGPLIFLGTLHDDLARQELLQLVWQEAGSYGARILVLAAEAGAAPEAAGLVELFAEWECDHVAALALPTRRQALDPAVAERIATATGIVLVGRDPLRFSATLGGTPLAQAIRRANATSKLVAGSAGAATFLCQHMLVHGPHAPRLRDQAGFAPGLGLVNRIVLDAAGDDAAPQGTPRLDAATALNPFLIGVGIEPDSAGVLYPDNTLQAYGLNAMTVVDSAGIGEVDLDLPPTEIAADPGIVRHHLRAGHTFNLDDRCVRGPADDDLPPITRTITSAY